MGRRRCCCGCDLNVSLTHVLQSDVSQPSPNPNEFAEGEYLITNRLPAWHSFAGWPVPGPSSALTRIVVELIKGDDPLDAPALAKVDVAWDGTNRTVEVTIGTNAPESWYLYGNSYWGSALRELGLTIFGDQFTNHLLANEQTETREDGINYTLSGQFDRVRYRYSAEMSTPSFSMLNFNGLSASRVPKSDGLYITQHEECGDPKVCGLISPGTHVEWNGVVTVGGQNFGKRVSNYRDCGGTLGLGDYEDIYANNVVTGRIRRELYQGVIGTNINNLWSVVDSGDYDIHVGLDQTTAQVILNLSDDGGGIELYIELNLFIPEWSHTSNNDYYDPDPTGPFPGNPHGNYVPISKTEIANTNPGGLPREEEHEYVFRAPLIDDAWAVKFVWRVNVPSWGGPGNRPSVTVRGDAVESRSITRVPVTAKSDPYIGSAGNPDGIKVSTDISVQWEDAPPHAPPREWFHFTPGYQRQNILFDDIELTIS